MNKLFVILLVAIFGIAPNSDKAGSDASTGVAYASLQKAEAPKPKPPGDAPLHPPCPEACKCEDCKCTNCPADCTAPAEWKWFPDAGEMRLMKGDAVTETRKYKKVAVMSCTGRRCVVTEYKWVPLQ